MRTRFQDDSFLNLVFLLQPLRLGLHLLRLQLLLNLPLGHGLATAAAPPPPSPLVAGDGGGLGGGGGDRCLLNGGGGR